MNNSVSVQIHLVVENPLYAQWRTQLEGFIEVPHMALDRREMSQTNVNRIEGYARVDPISVNLRALKFVPMMAICRRWSSESWSIILEYEVPDTNGVLVGQSDLQKAASSLDRLLACHGFHVTIYRSKGDKKYTSLFLRHPEKVLLVPNSPSLTFRRVRMNRHANFEIDP